MSGGWYDPVCYQFFFYMIDQEGPSGGVIGAVHAFFEELKPYYAQCAALGGRVQSRIHRQQHGYLMNMLDDADSIYQHFDSIAKMPAAWADEYEISLAPGKMPRQFAASARKLDKGWKEQALRFTDQNLNAAIDPAERLKWIAYLLNCPTEDLRGLCFPKKCFAPGVSQFVLNYRRMPAGGTLAYAQETVQESGLSPLEGDAQYFIHRLYVSLPRYVLDSMEEIFLLQEAWKARLTALSGAYETSVGYIKMDCCAEGRNHPLRTGAGNFKLGFGGRIPDVGWGMCLTQSQLTCLGGLEALRESGTFYCVEPLENGYVYLQLTPDVSIVPVEKARALWRMFSPHIERDEYYQNSMGDLPPSMRLGIDRIGLSLNDFGGYRLE